ncbi:GNAT family N-acetyltransferase [Gynuella sunshinyii]|uniref:Putative acetyltransferase n=1 Tax=Gynuella sunshinyii YC6258 TaxID=1445510 RepID=A0A0C5VGY3_9GAMM|nr:GNAT family N-acetyltransferase [Gynuella sunshinyii]AJQ92618.1 putative acetyltransferase [Gynuella sunshinyii YC6258]
MSDIQYRSNHPISADQFIALLSETSLGERRPINDRECMEGMVNNTNLIITAWHDDTLVGVARSMTDFHFACYLSDLAVHRNFQKRGIGKALIRLTQEQLKSSCKLILLAAPAASEYYQPLGFEHNPRAWMLDYGKLK